MQATAVAPAAVRPCSTSGRRVFAAPAPAAAAAGRWQQQQRRHSSGSWVARATVELQDLEGQTHMLDVPDGENVLDVALDKGIDLPYDCKMGVCLRCSAKVEAGSVDQSGGMISEDCQAEGYALLCVSIPKGDCRIRAIPEEELVDAVMA